MSDFEKRRDDAAEEYATGKHTASFPDTYEERAFKAGADWARMALDAGIHSELIKERDALKAELSAAAEAMNAHDKSRANVILERDALKAEVERLSVKLHECNMSLSTTNSNWPHEKKVHELLQAEQAKVADLTEAVERLKGDAFGRLLERRSRELAKEQAKSRRLAEALKVLTSFYPACGVPEFARAALAEYEGEKE
jgi:hypothetical protein